MGPILCNSPELCNEQNPLGGTGKTQFSVMTKVRTIRGLANILSSPRRKKIAPFNNQLWQTLQLISSYIVLILI